jgi:hypothetical protein
MPQQLIPANWNRPLRPLRTNGPPESPSQESFPPFEVPAHKNSRGIHSFCPDKLYICIHLLFDIIGRWTSLRTGEIWPYSDRLPQPVTLPVFPTRSESDCGRHIERSTCPSYQIIKVCKGIDYQDKTSGFHGYSYVPEPQMEEKTLVRVIQEDH